MKIARAEFWAAAKQAGEVPPARTPEIAIAGRSNVGKSSLINRLTGRKALARTSSTPGCTRGLTFFIIDDAITLVDLPGYGWAKRSMAERQGWKRLVEDYLQNRQALAGVLILVDVRRGPEGEELMLADFLEARQTEFAWVLTKSDKLSRSKLAARLSELHEQFGGRTMIVTSAKARGGVDETWKWMRAASGTMRQSDGSRE